MKTIKQGIITSVAMLFLSTVHTFAIEGLQIAVQCPNVVLSWPSVDGETYIIQYRPTLDPSTPWAPLTNSFPAATGTNITFFVHSNIVQNCGGGGSFAAMIGGGGGYDSATLATPVQLDIPMAIPTNGTGSAVPLSLYPPGFDLAGFLIFDPVTGESVSGSGYTISQTALNTPQPDGPQPDGGSGGGGGAAPDTGFYQVVRTGVHVVGLSNLTNGPASNSITILFEAGNAVGTLQEINVLVDGVGYRGASELVAPGITSGIAVDTSFLENGDHTFQVQAGWLNIDASDPNNFLIHQISAPFTLTVSNVIYYPDWVDTISELGSASFFAKTTCTNANWQIDIYDVNTNLAQTLTGYATNGVIEAYWNLIDTNGVARTNADVDTEFSSVITVGDPTQKKPPTQPVPFPYPTHASWAIAYQDTFSYMVNSNMYYNAIYQMGSLAANAGGASTVPPSFPTNGQCFPIRYTNIHQALNFAWVRSDETALLNLLTNRNIRNFYYNGHGGPNSISIFLSNDKFSQALKRQPYRFVFLDACSTANGKLPAAFGINYSGPKNLSDFQKDKTRPRAYLGYTRDVYYCESGSFIDPNTGATYPNRVRPEVTYFLTNFEFYWYFNYDLTSAIFNAINDTPFIGPGWQTGDDLKLFGYSYLGLDSYNYKTDWN